MNQFEHRISQAESRYFLKSLYIFVTCALVIGAAFGTFIYLRGVTVEVLPAAAREQAGYAITEGWGWFISNRALLLSEEAIAEVSSPGYISSNVTLSTEQTTLNVELQEAPGRIILTTLPALPDVQWTLNRDQIYIQAGIDLEMPPGSLTVEVRHPHFEVQDSDIDLPAGKTVEKQFDLMPVLRSLQVNSVPEEARIVFDGTEVGRTPLILPSVTAGVHTLELHLEGYLAIQDEMTVTNATESLVRDYLLTAKMATIEMAVTPPDGELTLNGMQIDPDIPHSVTPAVSNILHYHKPGYIPSTQEVTLTPGQHRTVSFSLPVETGRVTVRSMPAADIFLDGKSLGTTPQTFNLQTIPHTLTLDRSGYRQSSVTITPDPKRPVLVDETLQLESKAALNEAKEEFTNSIGSNFKLFRIPASRIHLTMGSPSHEPGQRANEFLRDVVLSKSFYVGITEVSNEQFSQFSGGPLTNPTLPKVDVTWLEVVQFCNWLSNRERLRPVYHVAPNGTVVGYDAAANGYRLLSEAEWEWLARMANRRKPVRFVWGDSLDIPANSGNFADESGRGSLPRVIPNYDDGYIHAAPVGSFPLDTAGLQDLAGNVSEWVHDVYDPLPPVPGQVEMDPMGLQAGGVHVVKGSNFRSAGLSEMRSTFREGLSEGRDDVGFRIARYVW